MSPTLNAFLRSWPIDPWLVVTMVISAAVYLRGWWSLNHRDPRRWHRGRLAAFLGGLTAIFVALASPLEPFAALLLQMHMVQHLLLMMVAPPLIWLGAPLFPLVRGLPEPVRKYWIAPLLRSRFLRYFFTGLTHPIVAWPLYVAVTWLWHTPFGYELALQSNAWHIVEHVCFFAVAMFFWYPVVRPYPSRPRWSQWLLLPYLILADVQNTVLAAWLTFANHVLYPHYEQVPRIGGISALDDQATAGVLMWVPGSIAFLLPLFWIGVGLLFGSQRERERHRNLQRLTSPKALPVVSRPKSATALPRFDLLRTPIVGRLLQWRFSRPAIQLLMTAVAVAVIVDGLRGPQVSPMNLAGVLPWIHWRGVLIFGLLIVGNVSCMACPFTLPRTFARRWMPAGRPWPRALRSKWLAVALVMIFLWSYEAFSLWDSPWLTAWIAIAYFVAAFVVDSCFRDAAFCKYLCPIGQFNFVQSLVSPLEVAVREPDVCTSCRTKECIRGSSTIPGCELHLYQPRKQGNLDCTFCLDCVHACPHENIGMLAQVPAKTLWNDSFRSGIGHFSRRPDLAALVLALVFGAFANAAGMVGPVVEWQDQTRNWLGNVPQIVTTTLYYVLAIVLLPIIAVGAAMALSRKLQKSADSWLTTVTRYSFAFVPLGFGMWLAHYSFHFLTSCDTIIPTTQRFAADLGWNTLGAPQWECACCRPTGVWLLHLEILMIDVGLLLSLYTGFRIAEATVSRPSQAIKAFAPWAALMLMLFAIGIWIVFQPMQMRGTLPLAG